MVARSFDANAPTIAAPLPLESSPLESSAQGSGSTHRLHKAARKMVAVIEGSAPHLSTETRNVLRGRLLAVSLLFFSGFLLFLVRWFLATGLSAGLSALPWVFWVHFSATLSMGLLSIYLYKALYKAKEMSLARCRWAELLAFGIPALFFVVVSQQKLSTTANLAEGAHLPVILGPWLMLIFTYALFVPNTWRRAASVLVPMGFAPIGVLLFQWAHCIGFGKCLHMEGSNAYITEQMLLMTLCVTIATVGVHLTNRLRREAFAAKQLGQYRLKQKLGAGGMGEVYLAEHQMLKRPCAIKLIKPDKAGDPQVLARFEREVRATAKLSHWNSIDVFDYGHTSDGTFYYVMEYLPGYNFGELVENDGPLPPARAVYLMIQVCSALAEAHGMGLVHRDIKPANIFCAYLGGEFDVAKLLDFGLVKPTIDTGEAHLTQEGAITGSPLFMSPEQATGEREADARSDIYSLGAVLYFMLTGRPPFAYQQPLKVIVAHVSETPVPVGQYVSDLPVELEEIVMRCLEKKPENRFPTVLALREALAALEMVDPWSSDLAAEWWDCKACPERKAMSAMAVEAAAL